MNAATGTIASNTVTPAAVTASETSPSSLRNIVQSLRNIATVSEALRVMGAAVIVSAISLYLLQGWNEGNDISRYMLLLAQTALLAVGGFAMSHGLREAKGARVFFGLALLSVPANFTVLGALVYSGIQLDGALTTYPGYATWQIGSMASVATTILGALIVLVPIAMFCFAIMARHSARPLSLHFAVLNLLLLLPLRTSLAAGLIVLAGALYILWAIRGLAQRDKALRTPEGRFALAMLFIPLAIVAFRSLYFYDVDSLMIAMLAAVGFFTSRQASLSRNSHQKVSLWLDVASLPLAAVIAGATTIAMVDNLATAYISIFAATLYAAFAADVVRRCDSDLVRSCAAASISLALASGFITSAAIDPVVLTSVLAMTAGLAMVVAGLWLADKVAVAAGVLTLLTGALFGYQPIVEMIVIGNWMLLALFGAAAIALGSVLDRHGVAIKLHVIGWARRLRIDRQSLVPDD